MYHQIVCTTYVRRSSLIGSSLRRTGLPSCLPLSVRCIQLSRSIASATAASAATPSATALSQQIVRAKAGEQLSQQTLVNLNGPNAGGSLLSAKERRYGPAKFTAEQVEALKAQSHDSSWTRELLCEVLKLCNKQSAVRLQRTLSDFVHASGAALKYLLCYTQIPGSEAALRTFAHVTGPLKVIPKLSTYDLLFQCMARDWRPEYADQMDALRAQMLKAKLRFKETAMLNSLMARFTGHSAALAKLAQWAREDKLWASLNSTSVASLVKAEKSEASVGAHINWASHPSVQQQQPSDMRHTQKLVAAKGAAVTIPPSLHSRSSKRKKHLIALLSSPAKDATTAAQATSSKEDGADLLRRFEMSK
jgi:transposase